MAREKEGNKKEERQGKNAKAHSLALWKWEPRLSESGSPCLINSLGDEAKKNALIETRTWHQRIMSYATA